MRHNIDQTSHDGYAHVPVMWREVLAFVKDSPHAGTGCLVDCTLGEGGHSDLLLQQCPGLNIIGFECDQEILQIAKSRLKRYEERIRFINDNFRELHDHLTGKESSINYFLYDFGISSYHFDKSGRGFSFGKDEYLDMRICGRGRTAFEVINNYDAGELTEIFKTLGEERWSRRIALAICREREKDSIETSQRLAEVALRAIPKRYHAHSIHPATRIFQAIRIHINDELGAIRESLEESWKYLAPGGRIIAIAFHSLEDRIVKNMFRGLSKGCSCGAYPERCGCEGDPLVKILTKKPMQPQSDEVGSNRRARSAKLRACERVN